MIAISAPGFIEREELIPFQCEKEPADLIFNVETAARVTVPDESWVCVHKETYIHSYEKEGRRARLFLDEQTGRPMLLDVALDERNHRVTLREESLFLWGSNLAMKVMDLPNQVIWRDGIFLHTSFIQVRGEAILFAAQKQVGKSTQAELWRVHRGAEIVNGDRALLRKRDGRWCAWGSPYCGTSGIFKNRVFPIAAVVLLSQAPENQIRPATAREMLAGLLDCCSFAPWDREQMERVMDITQSFMEEIPFYKLACLPDVSAVEALEDILW